MNTKSGRDFAAGPSDWQLWNNNALKVVQKAAAEGCKVVIISNQGGIKTALTGGAHRWRSLMCIALLAGLLPLLIDLMAYVLPCVAPALRDLVEKLTSITSVAVRLWALTRHGCWARASAALSIAPALLNDQVTTFPICAAGKASQNFQQRVHEVVGTLGVACQVFAATMTDNYRKPDTGARTRSDVTV